MDFWKCYYCEAANNMTDTVCQTCNGSKAKGVVIELKKESYFIHTIDDDPYFIDGRY